MSIFIIIPEIGSNTKYYIKPFDIINLREDNGGTLVSYRYGNKEASFITALSGKDIHEEMVRMEEEDFKQLFGGE